MAKKTKLVRVTPDLEKDLMKAMEVRFRNKLCSVKELNMREATELLRRTNGIQMSLEEIRSKPRRKR